MPGASRRFEDVDLLVVRENTEGLYSGLEHEVIPGVVESLRIVTEKASRRIVRFATGVMLATWWFEVVLPRIGFARVAERGRTARLMVDLVASLMGRKVFDRPTRSFG